MITPLISSIFDEFHAFLFLSNLKLHYWMVFLQIFFLLKVGRFFSYSLLIKKLNVNLFFFVRLRSSHWIIFGNGEKYFLKNYTYKKKHRMLFIRNFILFSDYLYSNAYILKLFSYQNTLKFVFVFYFYAFL